MTTTGAPFSTRPPTAIGHATTRPSRMVMPSFGMPTGTATAAALPELLACNRGHALRGRHVRLLEHAAERHRRVRRRHAADGCVQQVEATVGAERGHVGGDPAAGR